MPGVPEGFEKVDTVQAKVQDGRAVFEGYEVKPKSGEGLGDWELVCQAKCDAKGVDATSGTLKAEPPAMDNVHIEVPIDRSDPKSRDDKVTLKRDDGSYQETKAIADGEELRAGYTVLVFEDVPLSETDDDTFTCEIDPGADGDKYNLFEKRPMKG